KKEKILNFFHLKKATEVIKELRSQEIDILIVDMDSQNLDLQELKHHNLNTRIIGISSSGNQNNYTDTVFAKPIDIGLFLNSIYQKGESK
ncbi:MAG: hypothetical protein HRT43_12145, partial [Campylobacteraceae bacterium]|nr:hypothetical protein [Campylobacteraceae bacterium]